MAVAVSVAMVELSTFGGPAGAAGRALSMGATPSASGAATAVTSSGSLILTYQTPWVTPNQPFDLKLRTGGTGIPAPASLGVSVAVYGCLSSVSSFDQAATSSSPSGSPISHTTTPLAWNSLHPDPVGADLSLAVNTSGSASTAISSPNPTIDIHSNNTSCQAGVFPVRLQLVNTSSGGTIASLTTFMIYITAPADQKLRFAMVVPVSTPAGPASQPTASSLLANPADALARPSPTALSDLNQLVVALGTGPNPSVPVTVTANAQTLQALASAGHTPSITALAALSENSGVHQFAPTPYTPVDASALVDAGLGTELVAQLGRGSEVLTNDGIVHTTTPPPSGGSAPWITNDGLDDSTLAQLATSGYNQLILPPADVTSSPVDGSGAEPFNIDSTHGSSLLAITSNTDLASRMTAHPGDPVLDASQLLGELAQIYFEYPNLSTPRAVVAMPPTGSSPNPTMISTLLTDLSNNPFAQGVTTAGLFQTLSTPAACHGGCKLTSSGTSGSSNSSGLPVSGIHTQRSRIAGLASAIPATSPIALPLQHQLSDLVLASESENLKPSQQSSVIHNTGAALNAQLSQVSVSGDQSITLTSRNAQIPVSIASRAPYPITGTLTLTSDELLFANGTRRLSMQVPLTSANTTRYISVQARSSGESKLEITFSTPGNGMVITNGVIIVRSTATSVVGVVLSLGAVAVLLAWWLRTSFRRRKRRRSAAVAGSS